MGSMIGMRQDMRQDMRDVTAEEAQALDKVRAERRRIARLRAAAADQGSAACWHVLRTHAHAATVAERLAGHGIHAWCATIKVLVRRPREQGFDVVERAMFERYLFVRLSGRAEAFAGVMTIEGAAGLLGAEGRPLALPDATIAELQAIAAAPAARASRQMMFIGGESVRVKAGPFTGLTGVALGAESASGLINLELSVFSRLTPCTMAIDAIEKLA